MIKVTQEDEADPLDCDFERTAEYISSTAFGGSKSDTLNTLKTHWRKGYVHPLPCLFARHREEAARKAREAALREALDVCQRLRDETIFAADVPGIARAHHQGACSAMFSALNFMCRDLFPTTLSQKDSGQ